MQVVDLEHHSHETGHQENLSGAQTEFLVVVENRVHGLDPEGVDWPIKKDPLSLVLFLLIELLVDCLLEHQLDDSFVPVHVFVLSEQSSHGEAFRVDVVDVHLLESLHQRLSYAVERLLKHSYRCGLSASRRTNQHQSVSDSDGVVELEYFLHELFVLRQIQPAYADRYRLLECLPLYVRLASLGEQVVDDVPEETNVFLEEFGDVHLHKGLEKYGVLFVLVAQLSLDYPCGVDDRHDCPHSVVVVVLGGELLRGEPERGHHFLGQDSCLGKTIGVEFDLSNKSVVGDHHCHWPEKSFEVVGEFRSARVARIHSDEH